MQNFKVGDELKQVKEGNQPSEVGQIIKIESICGNDVECVDHNSWSIPYLRDNFELVNSLENLKVGDFIENKTGRKRRIIRIKYRTEIVSDGCNNGIEADWVLKELIKEGNKIVEPTIEIDGKEYLLSDVKERVEKLNPIK